MLIDKLNELNKERWVYYRNFNIGFENYQEAFDDSTQFIRNYFSNGGKEEFLYGSIADIADSPYENDEEKELYEKRRQHIVTTFFLGVYIFEKIDSLHFRGRTFLGKNKQYLWAWFICSLYHDLFYNEEFEKNIREPRGYDYCKQSNGLLYSEGILQKYFEKENDPNLCHVSKNSEGKETRNPHPDHGIVAAGELYYDYLKGIIPFLQEDKRNDGYNCAYNPNGVLEKFLEGEEVDFKETGIKISLESYFSICKIAKIIACHNVYICTKKGQEKDYCGAKLKNLIVGDPEFCYLPVAKKNGRIGTYEKLYFLLALVDTLEPTKRGINTAEIDINIEKVESHYEISISGGSREHLDGIKGMGTWLNFVEVSDDGHTLIIDFKNDKNKQNDDRVAEEERDAQ